jgi:hypothetical protein
MVLSLECQWIRVCGGVLPCCNKSENGCLEIWKNKSEIEKLYESGKNVHKKCGTCFNLKKYIFALWFKVLYR